MKNLLFLFAIFFAFKISAQIPTNGMIGGWTFTGNANDISGAGNHGTVMGPTLTTDRFGNANCAYKFVGTNTIVMMSAGPTGSVSRSVSFWAKTTNTVHQVAIGYGSAGNGGIFQVTFNYGCQGVGFDNSIAAVIRGNNTLTDNSWHHIVAIINSAAGVKVGDVEFYVDAVLQPSITCFVTSTTSLINSNANVPITLGYYVGDLDDFYFYNRPISFSEVQALYNDNCVGPSIVVSGPSIACAGSGINLAASGAASYTWQPGNLNGVSVTVSPTVSTSYTVTGTNTAGGCPGFTNYTQSVSKCTGIEQAKDSDTEILFFPNPAIDYITITNPGDNGNVEIFDAYGRLIRIEKLADPAVKIDMSDFPRGAYLIKVSASQKTILKKLIVL